MAAKPSLPRARAIVLQRADYSRMTYCRKSIGFPNIFFVRPNRLRTFAMETSKKALSHLARPTQKLNTAAHHKASPSFRYLGKHKVIGFRIIGEAVRTPHGSRGTTAEPNCHRHQATTWWRFFCGQPCGAIGLQRCFFGIPSPCKKVKNDEAGGRKPFCFAIYEYSATCDIAFHACECQPSERAS